jgi:hypothetical protein
MTISKQGLSEPEGWRMKALSEMTNEELEKLMSKLKEELDEVEEEKMYVLSQTGIHLPGVTVKKYDAEIDGLKCRIEETEKALHAKKH